MKGIKLTPLNMFILLVLVLILSIFLGYSVKESMKEGATPMSSYTEKVSNTTFTPYSSESLVIIKSADSISGSIYFDPVYGNVINVNDQPGSSGSPSADTNNSPFIVVTRSGQATEYTPVNGSTPDLGNVLQSSQNIGQVSGSNTGSPSNYSWSYNHFGMTIIYVTWDTQTVIYTVNNMTNYMDSVYVSEFISNTSQYTFKDVSIKNYPLPVMQSNVITAIETTQTNVNGVLAWQITDTVFFNFEKGIFVKSLDGFNISQNSQYSSGSTMEYDNQSNTAVVSTKFMHGKEPAALLIIIANAGKNGDQTQYQVNTTVRILDTSSNPFNRHTSGSGSGSGSGSDSGSGSSCENDPYILKTQIVPPVCPMCPNSSCDPVTPTVTPSSSPERCNVFVNDKGVLVNCHGVEINTRAPASVAPTGGSSMSPEQYFGQGITDTLQTGLTTAGKTIDNAVTQTAGLAGKGLDDATNLAGTTVQTAGSTVSSALQTTGQTATGLASGLEGAVTGITGDVTKMVSGLGSDVTGVANKGIGAVDTAVTNVAGIGSDLVNRTADIGQQALGSATGLAYATGAGAYDLAQQGLYRDPYGIVRYANGTPYPVEMIPMQGQQALYPGYPVYQTGVYQGYGTCANPYPMQPTGYEVMPVTNDFSQFS